MSSIGRDFGRVAVGGSVLLVLVGAFVVFLPSLNVFGIDSRLAGVVAMNAGVAGFSLGLFLLTRAPGINEPEQGEPPADSNAHRPLSATEE